MVSPKDLGIAAATRLLEPPEAGGIHYIEGPHRYSARDVADAFAKTLARPVDVEVVPRAQWKDAYQTLGFSEAAADSYARMTAATLDGDFELPQEPERGRLTLQDFVRELVSGKAGKSGP